jgi:DNA-binding transcriptional MerR regulator
MTNFDSRHYSEKTERIFMKIMANSSPLAAYRKADKTLSAFNDAAMGDSAHISARVLSYWAKRGLAPEISVGWRAFSAIDIAQIQILVVLARRGWSLNTLIKIKNALRKGTGDGMSYLEFAVCYVNGPKRDDLYLVINGDNKCAFALADDLPRLIKNDTDPTLDSPSTYSHTILNLNRIITDCNLVSKISRGAEHFTPAGTRSRK